MKMKRNVDFWEHRLMLWSQCWYGKQNMIFYVFLSHFNYFSPVSSYGMMILILIQLRNTEAISIILLWQQYQQTCFVLLLNLVGDKITLIFKKIIFLFLHPFGGHHKQLAIFPALDKRISRLESATKVLFILFILWIIP